MFTCEKRLFPNRESLHCFRLLNPFTRVNVHPGLKESMAVPYATKLVKNSPTHLVECNHISPANAMWFLRFLNCWRKIRHVMSLHKKKVQSQGEMYECTFFLGYVAIKIKMIYLFIYPSCAQFVTLPRDKFPVDHQDLEGLDPEWWLDCHCWVPAGWLNIVHTPEY